MKITTEGKNMALISIGTFTENTVKASLTIEKKLIYPSYKSNYESKNLVSNICKSDVISDIEWGLQLMNRVKQDIFTDIFCITFVKTKKIILDSFSINDLTRIFCKLAEDNSKKRICLSNIEVIIADNLI